VTGEEQEEGKSRGVGGNIEWNELIGKFNIAAGYVINTQVHVHSNRN